MNHLFEIPIEKLMIDLPVLTISGGSAIQASCTYCFSETAWAENRLTPTSCGAKVFSLKFRELGALTETVGISHVFGRPDFFGYWIRVLSIVPPKKKHNIDDALWSFSEFPIGVICCGIIDKTWMD